MKAKSPLSMYEYASSWCDVLNPIQAGVFWNHIGWGGGSMCPPLFVLYFCSNYNQTWHDGTLGQNLSKAMQVLLMSSLGDKYDVIKLFLVSFQVKIRVPFSFCPMELKFGTGVNSEALISTSSQKIRHKYVLKEKNAIFYEKLKFLPKCSMTKVLPWQHPRLLLTENYFK